jgi:hypothetical protein
LLIFTIYQKKKKKKKKKVPLFPFWDIVRSVTSEATENDEDVVHVELAQDRNGILLARGHCLSYFGNVRVVPGIVVH